AVERCPLECAVAADLGAFHVQSEQMRCNPLDRRLHRVKQSANCQPRAVDSDARQDDRDEADRERESEQTEIAGAVSEGDQRRRAPLSLLLRGIGRVRNRGARHDLIVTAGRRTLKSLSKVATRSHLTVQATRLSYFSRLESTSSMCASAHTLMPYIR